MQQAAFGRIGTRPYVRLVGEFLRNIHSPETHSREHSRDPSREYSREHSRKHTPENTPGITPRNTPGNAPGNTPGIPPGNTAGNTPVNTPWTTPQCNCSLHNAIVHCHCHRTLSLPPHTITVHCTLYTTRRCRMVLMVILIV